MDHANKTRSKIGKKEGLRGRYLLAPLESLTYTELSDLIICGCRKIFSKKDALKQHILRYHDGVPPANTLCTD